MKQVNRNILHLIRNVCIFLLTFFGVAYVYRRFLCGKGPLVRVLVFHDIHERRWLELLLEDLTLWFHFVTPEEFYARKFHSRKINILITFDDGYASWESAALSVLEEYNLKGLFFVNSALLDVAHDEEGANLFMREQLLISPRPPLTWEGVKKIHKAGHTVGGHTLTHPNLTAIPGERACREVCDDKHSIEHHLDTTLTDFAYPFGTRSDVNERTERIVRESGYLRAYTTMSHFVDFTDCYAIPRMCVESGIHSRALRRWILGGYDIFTFLKNTCVR